MSNHSNTATIGLKKVLITGGTGFVGATVVRKALEEKGLEVRALVRRTDSSSAQRLRELGAEVFPGDILDPTSLDRALADGSCDAVIHLVGIIAESGGGQTYRRIHDLGTRNVVDATFRAGIDRYLHMSALGTGPDAESGYHRTKWSAEQYVRASELEWTIFRPSIITGADDLFINRFALFSKLKIGTPLPKFGTTKFQPVTVDDVAEAFLRALGRSETIGQCYDVVGPDIVSLYQLVRGIERAAGTWGPKIPFPLFIASIMSRILRYLPYPLDLNPAQVTMMKRDNTGDIEPMRRDLDLEPTPFQEGIERFLAPDKAARRQAAAAATATKLAATDDTAKAA